MSDVNESDLISNISDDNIEKGIEILEEEDKPLEKVESPTYTPPPLKDEEDDILEEEVNLDNDDILQQENIDEEDEEIIYHGEGADTDFIIDKSEEKFIQDKEITEFKIQLGATYLLILLKSGKYTDYIGDIIDANPIDNSIILDNDDKDVKPIKVNINDNDMFLEDGVTEVKELICINEIELQTLLDDEEVFKEKSIKLDVLEIDKQYKQYNESEIKEDFISEIINLYNIFDDELLINKITNMAYSFFDLIKENKYISDIDRTDVLSFIKNMINNNEFKLPDFILPIVSLKKKLFTSGDEILNEKSDTSISTLEEELIEKYTLMNEDNTGYIKTLNILFNTKFNSYITSLDKYGIQINYNGKIIRDCLNDLNPCSDFKDLNYNIDLLQSRSELYDMNDNEKNIYLENEIFNIIGLLFIPEQFSKYNLNLKLHNKYFNLYENILLFNRSYSTTSFRQALSNNNIVNKNINFDSLKNTFDNQFNAFMFDLNDNINLYDLSTLLSNTLPNTKSIVDNLSIIKNHLYNFNDFEKLLLIYNISINDLLYEDKNKIINLIKNNINNYQKIYKKLLKPKSIKKLKIINKDLDISDKIKLVKELIFNTKNIKIKNNLISKFIKIYCREASNDDENINWLYSTDTNEQILCKHYYYSTKINNDNPEYYESLKSIFCPDSDDGNVCCSVCGHLIDNVDFTTFSGYSDGTVINTYAELNQDTINTNITEGNDDIKEEINNISKKFNIKLLQNDLENIVKIYNLIDNEKFINYRYNTDNYFNNNNFVNKIKEKYPNIKNKEQKKLNDKNKKKKNKAFNYFKQYLLKYNKLLSISFLLFIHIQISTNIYKINLNDMYNVLIYDKDETWKNLSLSNDITSINKRIIQYIEIKLEDDIENINDNVLHNEFLDNIKFNNHFIKTIKYFMHPQFNLYNSINKYFTLNKNLDNIFIKKSWPNFKPLYDNKLVSDINLYISSKDNQFKQFFINNDSLENISLLKDINNSEPKYIEYKLSISNLMNNPSYKRLYMYSLKLYGKSKPFPILNLLIKQFINTINNNDINQLLIECDYSIKDGFKSVNYKLLKQHIIGSITNYEIDNTKDKDNILKFKHINLNNTEYLLLNCISKDFYRYNPSKIFIDSNFDDLINENSEFLDKLFNNYCIDGNGELIKNLSNENILNFYLIDYRTDLKQNLSECNKTEINKDFENFERIMNFLPFNNKLSLKIFIQYTEKYTNDDIFKYLNFNTTIENRLLTFFTDNIYLNNDDEDNLFIKLNNIISNIKDNKLKNSIIDPNIIINQFDSLLPELTDKKNEYFKNMEELYTEILSDDEYYNKFNKFQILRLKNLKLSNLNNIQNTHLILDKLTEDINDTYTYKRFVDDIYFTISRLKNKYRSYNLLKKNTYKLNETNINEYNKYIDVNEFLLHNDLFFQRNKSDLTSRKKYSGFKEYNFKNSHIYFQDLYNYIHKYNINFHKLKGSINNLLDNDLLLSINKFIFIFIINKIVEFIQSLLNPESDNYKILYSKYLEFNDENISIKNCIINLSRFLLDLLINIYEKYYDKIWIYINNNDLNMSIMKQLSREKHTYLQKTQGMTKEQKIENDIMNDMGKATLYKDFEQDNQNYSKSYEYEKDVHPEMSDIEVIDVQEGYDEHLYDQEENDEITE